MNYRAILRETDDFTIWRRAATWLTVSIAATFPQRRWYDAAYRLSGQMARFSSATLRAKSSHSFIRAKTLNTLLALLTRAGENFPVNCTLGGQQILHDQDSGLALCSVHLPLVKVTIAELLKRGYEIDAAIVGRPLIDGKMSLWGTSKKIPVLYRSAAVLLKAKTILQNKGRMVLMIDRGLGGGYSDNALKLCGLTGSRVAFFVAALKPGGQIETRIVLPPHPFCENEIAIAENLQFLDELVKEIMNTYRKNL